jgi:hypothetical protein
VHFRSHAELKAHLMTFTGGTGPGGTITSGEADSWLTNTGWGTEAAHAAACQNLAMSAIKTIFNAKMPADDGISLFHAAYSIQLDLLAKMTSFTDGEAYDFAAGSSSKCAFLWTAPTAQYAVAAQGVAATPAHEIGHHLMLPHPKNTGENTGANAGNDYSAHDNGMDNCLMSYKNGARELCGFCQLRLRGWDKSVLSTTSATNKKP